MSRIGKKPIPIPKGVTVKIEGNTVAVQGPKGKLDTALPAGIRVEQKGKGMVVFTLGYSHPIEYPLPTGVDATVDPKQTKIAVSGIDRQKVGQVAAEMRSLRPPDPYKNKGVRYAGERLKKKV